MNGDRCKRNNCTGTIEDGYCDVCGLAEIKADILQGTLPHSQRQSGITKGTGSVITTGTGSSPLTNRSSKGSRRSSSTTSRSSRRQLGAGLVSIPPIRGAML